MMLPSERTLTRAAVVSSAACWGGATVLSKAALASLPPVTLLACQLVCSGIFLWVTVLLWGLRAPRFPAAIRVGCLGFLEPGMAYFFALVGLSLTSATNATLIGSTEAIMIALLARALLGETIRPSAWFWALMAVGGVIVVNGVGSEAAGRHSALGGTLIAAGTFCASLYVVKSKSLTDEYHPVMALALQQVAGLALALLALPLEPALAPRNSMLRIDFKLVIIIASSGVLQYAVPFALYIYSLRRMRASSAAMFLNLIPVFGIVGAAMLLHERPTLIKLAGAALTVFSVVMFSSHSHESQIENSPS